MSKDLSVGEPGLQTEHLAYWAHLPPQERAAIDHLQIKADNGPESSGRRTRFLQRMVDFCDSIGKPIELLY